MKSCKLLSIYSLVEFYLEPYWVKILMRKVASQNLEIEN